MNKIGLPVTNLPSSWCIYTNRERSAQACPHFIVNTNTPGVDGVSSCGKHTKENFAVIAGTIVGVPALLIAIWWCVRYLVGSSYIGGACGTW